jgi:cellulose synthase/poly-beta-1,6-N-acetylglucosamine synthase-like glycosyltransferase
MAIQRLGYKIAHENRAIAWTEAPATWSDFMKQRFRWIYGTLQCAVRHSDMILRREPRALALYSLPSIFLFNLALPVISPLMDLLMIWGITRGVMEVMYHPASFDLRDQVAAVLTYLVFIMLDAVLSVVAFSREPSESKRLLLYLPFQRLCDRQVLCLVALRVIFACVRGDAQGWNKLGRAGSVDTTRFETKISPTFASRPARRPQRLIKQQG